MPALDSAMDKTTGIGARIDLVLAKVRLGLFSYDNELVAANITKALESVPRAVCPAEKADKGFQVD